MQMLTLKAAAKLNLSLEVLGKRNDGYHEIKSVMQTISLFDILSFRPADNIVLSCSIRELQSENNLIFKAADALRQVSGYKGGAQITLEKQIPLQAGLGGGSSDAAAALIGLNKLWSLDIATEKLEEIASEIGSDVPFFIRGGTSLLEGRGEIVTPLPDMNKIWFVLMKPAMVIQGNKTGRLYSLIRPNQYTSGEYSGKIKNCIFGGQNLAEAMLYNVFDSVAEVAYPALESYRSMLSNSYSHNVHLAGSGPCMFTITNNESKARELRDKWNAANLQSFLVSSVSRGELGY
jgi:4-diphosphocytidyl-2-C-methyl-D-erythritol kinase